MEREYGEGLPLLDSPPNMSPKRWSFAASVEYQIEQFQRPDNFTAKEGIVDLKTTVVPLSITAHHDGGATILTTFSQVRQKGTLLAFAGFSSSLNQDSTFWVTDLELRFHVKKPRAFFSLGVRNLQNRNFSFRETDDVVLRFSPQRFLYGKVAISF